MKRRFGKAWSYVLTAAMIFGITIPNSTPQAKAKTPKLSAKKISIKVGAKKKLQVKNTAKKATWSIKSGKKYITLSAKKKASVTVNGKKAGKAVVLAKVGTKKLTCAVTVTKKTAATKTPAATKAPTENNAAETVKDVVIDMSKVGTTTFSAGGAKIDFSSQLDSRFNLKYYEKLVVTWEASGYDDTWTNGKIGFATESGQLDGYSDGAQYSYDLIPSNNSLTMTLTGDAAEGTACGINVQAMTSTYSWPTGLTLTITGITFVAKAGATYPTGNEPTATPTATPGPAYSKDAFTYEGLDTEYLATLDSDKPTVAFTFDDGPVGTSDDAPSMIIQKALKAHGAHATFFYIGSQITTEAEDEIRQAKENGFEVGNHSSGWDSLSSKEAMIKDSVETTNAKLTELTGYSNFLFRAPNLSVNSAMLDYIHAPLINCSVDSKDWTGATADEIYANVTKNAADGGMDGGIVLMHERGTKTYQTIDKLLDYFVDEGYQVVSVSELFYLKGKTLTTGTTYSSAN